MRTMTIFSILSLMLTSCSISFQNLDTHGESSDLIDENQTAQPNISPVFSKKKHKKIEDKETNSLILNC
jgi:hypothetical protein